MSKKIRSIGDRFGTDIDCENILCPQRENCSVSKKKDYRYTAATCTLKKEFLSYKHFQKHILK